MASPELRAEPDPSNIRDGAIKDAEVYDRLCSGGDDPFKQGIAGAAVRWTLIRLTGIKERAVNKLLAESDQMTLFFSSGPAADPAYVCSGGMPCRSGKSHIASGRR